MFSMSSTGCFSSKHKSRHKSGSNEYESQSEMKADGEEDGINAPLGMGSNPFLLIGLRTASNYWLLW